MTPKVISPDPAGRPRERSQAAQSSRRDGLFEPLDWALVRAPLMPIEAYLGIRSHETADTESLVPGDPRVRGALTVASPDLLAALRRISPSDSEAPRLRAKLLRFLIRMSTRPTPYGLFAGVGLASWGPQTDLRLAARPPRTRTRPDMAWLLEFVLEQERRPEVRRGLRLVANGALLLRAGRVFLSEPASAGESARGAAPVSLRATGAVRRALEVARTPIGYEDLASELMAAPGASVEKVERLITELWEQGILLTDLRPPLTGASPAAYVHDRLARIPAAADAAERLRALLDAMQRCDELPLADRADVWPRVVDQAHAAHPLQPSAAALQVDMALALAGEHLDAVVAQEAARAGELLLRLSPFPRGVPQLEAYRAAFEARYGSEREVPLLEMLDPQFGLGPPDRYGPGWDGLDARRSADRQQTLRDLALDAYRDRRSAVELDDDLLARLETWSPTPETAPLSLDVSVFVAASSPSAITAGDFRVVVGPNLGATAAGRNLGRFGDLLGPRAHDLLEHAARTEERHVPDRLWAEVVYLPQRARSANVAIRPAVRHNEIVIGTTAGVAAEDLIPLDELHVGVGEGRFYVRWATADVDIVACAGHMLNPYQAPAAARFLDDVARDGRVQLSGFDWGPAAAFPFVPRVQRGRLVLALAQWRIDPATEPLPIAHARAFAESLPAWRAQRSVPRNVYVTVGDNRLLLDLEDQQQAELLRDELRRLGEGRFLALQEALPGPEHAWLQGPDGRYMAEVVVPVALRAGRRPRPDRERARAAHGATPASRLKPPGSDWLFLKLYCPSALEEELIAGPLRSFGEFTGSAGLADRWLFLRYNDPDFHLRVRFHGDPSALLSRLLPQVCTWADELIRDGSCLRFAFDTYDRELERYGGEQGTGIAEAIFCADSPAVAEILHQSRAGLPTIDRVTLAVLSIDDLLAGLGASDDGRLAWYRERVRLSREDGQDYRQRQATLRELLGRPDTLANEPGGRAVAEALAIRRRRFAECAAGLGDLDRRGELDQPLSRLYRSYVHLHCNRLLGTASPLEERALALLRRVREGLSRAPVT